MGTQKQYDLEFKVHVVKESLIPDNKHDAKLIAEKYGINPSTLSHWKRLYLQYGEAGLDAKQRKLLQDQRVRELEKENKDLKEEVAILKKAAAFLAEVGRK